MSALSPVTTVYALEETRIGPCGLAWTASGLVRVHLPESTPRDTERRLQTLGARPATGTPPAHVAGCFADLDRYFAGGRVQFANVVLDMADVTPFNADVYDALRRVPWGQTTSYGQLAAQIGVPQAARAVGVAMARNPWPIVVPCHRVLAARGALGGFSAYGGRMTKQALLTLEAHGLETLPLFQ